MNPREKGFLLLTSQLGNPERRVLTTAQLRWLTKLVTSTSPEGAERDLTAADLLRMGVSYDLAQRIVCLLDEEDLLEHYLRRGNRAGCVPITRVSPDYPLRVRRALGLDSPGCLWAKGNLDLLEQPKIALVGSRELNPPNYAFAREVGRQAALQGYVLVSGNARGADRTGQESCLEHGGSVISVVADRLESHTGSEHVLYLCEEDFDADFSSQRALSRNRVIHALGDKTLVAQCRLEQGGTWRGTAANLRCHYSPVFCFADGSPGCNALQDAGAVGITAAQLEDLGGLEPNIPGFFDI